MRTIILPRVPFSTTFASLDLTKSGFSGDIETLPANMKEIALRTKRKAQFTPADARKLSLQMIKSRGLKMCTFIIPWMHWPYE